MVEPVTDNGGGGIVRCKESTISVKPDLKLGGKNLPTRNAFAAHKIDEAKVEVRRASRHASAALEITKRVLGIQKTSLQRSKNVSWGRKVGAGKKVGGGEGDCNSRRETNKARTWGVAPLRRGGGEFGGGWASTTALAERPWKRC